MVANLSQNANPTRAKSMARRAKPIRATRLAFFCPGGEAVAEDELSASISEGWANAV